MNAPLRVPTSTRTALMSFLQLLNCGWIHPQDFPVVPVQIVEAPGVHEAVVLGIDRVRAARRDRLLHHLVHFRATLTRQREESFRLAGGIAQLALGERLEER